MPRMHACSLTTASPDPFFCGLVGSEMPAQRCRRSLPDACSKCTCAVCAYKSTGAYCSVCAYKVLHLYIHTTMHWTGPGLRSHRPMGLQSFMRYQMKMSSINEATLPHKYIHIYIYRCFQISSPSIQKGWTEASMPQLLVSSQSDELSQKQIYIYIYICIHICDGMHFANL